MGNCLETCITRKHEENSSIRSEDVEEFEKIDDASEKGSVKVKIVLTKEELEWLLQQLDINGGKRLEHALMEIGKERGKVEKEKAEKGWKPALESIMENPEVQSMDI